MTANTTSFKHGPSHPKWTGDSDPALLGKTFGHLTIVSAEIQRKNGYKCILCKCGLTGKTEWMNYTNVIKDKTKSLTKNGKVFSQVNKTLGKRYDAIVKRCTNTEYNKFKDYGGRGIENRFTSRGAFVTWVKEHLPHPDYRALEIDRIDNDGHYEPGNLRLVTRQENLRNRRNTVRLTFEGRSILIEDFNSPYGYTPTARYASLGLTGEQIIANAELAVMGKRKNWRGIQARLAEIESSKI